MTTPTPLLRGLYVITDDKLSGPHVLNHVQQALEGGASIVQYRNKTGQAAIKEMTARSLLELCRTYRAPLIINDDLKLAARIGADGVHLGQTDASLIEARQHLGSQAIIGVTCHASLSLAKQAQERGADYVAFGRFFNSATKPEAPPAPLQLLSQARRELAVPICAIGGITIDSAPVLLESGADLLAIIHGVFGQKDITLAANQFASLWPDR